MRSLRSALIVVDMQEDFCPPNGSMAVPGGRDIASTINSIISLPFTARVATQDWHPSDHISFDTQHSPPKNKAFESFVEVINPDDESQTKKLQLWPVHCVKNTKGAEIISDIDTSKFDLVVQKGQDQRTEMFSAFEDMFSRHGDGVVSHNLAEWLHEQKIRTCFVVGLTGDCCVKATALDSNKQGFQTFVVKDATRSVDEGENGWGAAEKDLTEAGVIVIESSDQRLQSLMG